MQAIYPAATEMNWQETESDSDFDDGVGDACSMQRHAERHGDPDLEEDDQFVGTLEIEGGDGGASIWRYKSEHTGDDMLWINGGRADGSKWEFHVLMTDTVGATLKTAQAHTYRHCGGTYVTIQEMWYCKGEDNITTHCADNNQRMDIPSMRWEDVKQANWYGLDIYFNVY